MNQRRVVVYLLLLLLSLRATSFGASPQADDSYSARRSEAMELMKANKFVDAFPLLEKLHTEKPDDIPVLEALAFAAFSSAATIADEQVRKQERVRARKLAEEAQKLGDTSNLLKVLLEEPADGSEVKYSGLAEVEALMRQGETAFAKGDFDAALAAYKRALDLDPKQYFAALFVGDVYFKRKEYDQAETWFQRAVQINPNTETAHRYWGDDLVAENKMPEAKVHFVDAVVADPYNRRAWVGLIQWAQKQKLTLAHPAIQPRGTIEDKGKDDKGRGQTNITLDPAMLDPNAKKDGTSAWFAYTLFRAPWHGDKFQKEFPNEKGYRHTLREEAEALQGVVDQVKEGLRKHEIKQLDPALVTLVALSDQGLLESFVLISKADAGIVKDYPAYREAHREQLRRYISEFMIHP
jgi:tetratricopeptide (TPR) repeat protein